MELDLAIADTLSDPRRVEFLHASERRDVLTLLRLLAPSASKVRDRLVIESVRRAGFEVAADGDGFSIQPREITDGASEPDIRASA